MRTADSACPIAAPAVAASLTAFVVVYFFVFGAGIWYLLRLFRHPPMPHEAGPRQGEPIRTAGITPPPSMQRPAPPHAGPAAGARAMSAGRSPLIWAFLIATAVFLYVCMDGFDLGVGILFPVSQARTTAT